MAEPRHLRTFLIVFLLALIGAGFQHGHAQAAPAFGCPAQLASLDFPEPRVCLETQGWWLQGASATLPPNAAVASTHVHLMIPFPMGERVVIPSSGGYSWPYYAQFHNGASGVVRQVRGGAWQLSSCCPKDPNYLSVPISSVDQNHVGSIPIAASLLGAWRTTTGKRENRFTADTTSPFGKRQYQSGAWNAYLNAPGAPVGFTARGWYEGPGYSNFTFKDSNIGAGVGFRASELASTCAPGSVSLTYSLAEGTTLAFLYLDPNLHAGSKGTVVAENKTGSSGTFTFSTVGLSPGVHVALGGAWEKTSNGWNAGVARLPFRVC